MAWPTDDLTVTHLDASTDDPSQARQELLDAVNKIKSILGEAPSGSTIWHSNNDGAGSGLDADTLDGSQSDFYRDASNLAFGTVPLSRLPVGAGAGLDADLLDGQQGSHYLAASNLTGTISSGQIATFAVTNDKIQNGSINQIKLKSTTGEVSTGSIGTNLFALPGGQYGFYPEIRASGSSVGGVWNIAGNNNQAEVPVGTSYLPRITLSQVSTGGIGTIYAQQRYIQSSPPYKIASLDFGLFVFAHLDSNNKIISISTAQDPTWWVLNPTPNEYDEKGNAFLTRKVIPNSIKELKKKNIKEYVDEVKKIKPTKELITPEKKNTYMDDVPHPFHGVKEDERVVLLSPAESDAEILAEMQKEGESINELIHDDYIRIDEEVDAISPRGVKIHKFHFKNVT